MPFLISSRYWYEFRHRVSMFSVIPMLSLHKPVYCQEFWHRVSMFSVIPMLSLHKPIYCQELWHRVSMFSVIPMPFRHRYLKQLAYSMFLVSKRKVLAPYFKTFSHIISYFHKLKHRVSMLSMFPMPFPHKLTLLP